MTALQRAMHEVTEMMDLPAASDRSDISDAGLLIVVARKVSQGLTTSLVDRLLESGWKPGEISWIVPPRTLKRRVQSSQSLSQEESERLVRALKIQELAKAVFGSHEKAHRWLTKPRKAFDNTSAAELMQTEQGADAVEEELIRIDYGFVA